MDIDGAERAYETAEATLLTAIRSGGPMALVLPLFEQVAAAADRWNSLAYAALHESAGDERASLDLLTERTEVLGELWRDLTAALAEGNGK